MQLSNYEPANLQIEPHRLAKFNCMQPTVSIRKCDAQKSGYALPQRT